MPEMTMLHVRKKRTILSLLILTCIIPSPTHGQDEKEKEKATDRLLHGIDYMVEAQGSFCHGNTPLWLNANKYGLSSLEESNGYIRAGVARSIDKDNERKWGVGYAVDLACAANYTSSVIVQQAYAEGRWLHGTLTVGSKEWAMELKNNELSSGAQTLGKNARPVPQVRIALADYYTLPLTKGWLHLKGHIAYGKMTDDNWQHEFTGCKSKYADDVLYHSKAGYLKIGNEDLFYPVSVELGLEMASQFGGTTYRNGPDGTMVKTENATGIKAFWNAFVPGGSDSNETTYKNVEGNHVGSWLIRLNYDDDKFGAHIYLDKFFEDHSSMFQFDYDGYGSGEEWDKKKKSRYFMYDFKDWMLGTELNFKDGSWIRDIVVEYLYTKYQSGPIYHDHTQSISDHISGRDNFYNHGSFTGWQHWGQVMGNPLYRSPIYNTDGTINIDNNRFMALHLGVAGMPSDRINYRILATYQDGLGTYDKPYTKKRENVSFMAEVAYAFGKKLEGWSVKGGYGMDIGKIYGDNYGFQLSITKKGIFSR